MRFLLPSFIALSLLFGCGSSSECDSSRDCSGMGLVCDTTIGFCVECLTQVDCFGASEICTDGVCLDVTPCTTSRACPAQVCDIVRGYCVDCTMDIDCPAGQMCGGAGTCMNPPMMCTSDRQCSALDLVCDLVDERCVECVRDVDCLGGGSCIGNSCVR